MAKTLISYTISYQAFFTYSRLNQYYPDVEVIHAHCHQHSIDGVVLHIVAYPSEMTFGRHSSLSPRPSFFYASSGDDTKPEILKPVKLNRVLTISPFIKSGVQMPTRAIHGCNDTHHHSWTSPQDTHTHSGVEVPSWW